MPQIDRCWLQGQGQKQGSDKGPSIFAYVFFQQTTSVCRWWVGSDQVTVRLKDPRKFCSWPFERMGGWVSFQPDVVCLEKHCTQKWLAPNRLYMYAHYHKEPTSLKMLYRPIGQNSENILLLVSEKGHMDRIYLPIRKHHFVKVFDYHLTTCCPLLLVGMILHLLSISLKSLMSIRCLKGRSHFRTENFRNCRKQLDIEWILQDRFMTLKARVHKMFSCNEGNPIWFLDNESTTVHVNKLDTSLL